MKMKPGMSYDKAKKAELEKARVDKKMGAAMSGAGASESQVREAKESVRSGRNSGPQGVHTEPGNFQEKKSVATSSSKINTTDQKSIKPKLEKARVDEGKPEEEKVKDRSARNSRFPKKWANPKAKEGDFAGKPRSNAETQSGVHESPGAYKKGATGSFRDGGGKKDKIDYQASHSMVKQGLKNINPKLPDVKKSEFKSGTSYRDIKKDELEKGIFHDTMAGISLAAAAISIGQAKEEKMNHHMPMGHIELHDTGGHSSEQVDPSRSPATVTPEKIQTVKQKIKEIRSKIKPAKGQE